MNLPAGSNLLCDGNIRVRRDWDLIGDFDRELYFDAIETAIERGVHKAFVLYHADIKSDVQAHERCSFFLWHRRFILAYGNMDHFPSFSVPVQNKHIL